MSRFKDKVILITASATGIGLAMAHLMAQEGGILLINSRKLANVEKGVQEITSKGYIAHAMVGNISKKEEREKIAETIKQKFGRLDVLVINHATSLHFGSTLDTTEAQMDKMWDTNVKSGLLLIKELYPLIQEVKGNILINSSYVGYTPDQYIGVYSLTKSALLGMVKLLAKEFQSEGVRVNGVAPGLIKTKLSENMWKEREEMAMQIMGVERLGRPEDIANAAAFLCSDQASYITGETIPVLGRPSPRL